MIFLTTILSLGGCASRSTTAPEPLLARATSVFAHGTVRWWTPFGYFFGSWSHLQPIHALEYRHQRFLVFAHGHQSNWKWKILVSSALLNKHRLCYLSSKKINAYWERSFPTLRSVLFAVMQGKIPGLDLNAYLVPAHMKLDVFVRRFSFSSIPLEYYFRTSVHTSKDGPCEIQFSEPPVRIIAHELIHALDDIGAIPRAKNLIEEETRAYLFDRLVVCTYPSPMYPCRPLKFHKWDLQKKNRWLLKIPDQLARVVASRVVKQHFKAQLFLQPGSTTYKAYASLVRQIMQNPDSLKNEIEATRPKG